MKTQCSALVRGAPRSAVPWHRFEAQQSGLMRPLGSRQEDIAYNIFEHHVLAQAGATQVSARMRRMARRRSLVVLAGFTTAMLAALVAPRLGV